MYRVSGTSMMAAGLCLMLGTAPSWAGPPNNDVSDAIGNTAGGTGALPITTGGANTAFGLDALQKNTIGYDNTAFGAEALQFNIDGVANTAIGIAALQKNNHGGGNTAVGYFALDVNLTGGLNTAVGEAALGSNTTGSANTAIGQGVLAANTTGNFNTALGNNALQANTGGSNTAVGYGALFLNATGGSDTAVGLGALESNTTGVNNTAIGEAALQNNTNGSNNIALGQIAGNGLKSGSNNIYLGAASPATESNTIRLGQTQTGTFIAGIAGTALSGTEVLVSSTGQLGILASSARYKRDIYAMGARSRRLFELRPVIFRYKQDPQRIRQYGLIAEEVAKIYPELVTRRSDGTVESVQYHELIPMLLNELQRQQRELAELKVQSARLQATLAEQTPALKARLVRLEETTHSAALASR